MINTKDPRSSSISILKNPKFRRAYCLKPQFNYDSLRPYCDDIVFVTDGFRTKLTDLAEQIEENMIDFNPREDCIIPTGTSITNIFIGFYLCQKFPLSSVVIALFQKQARLHGKDIPESYRFFKIYINNLLSGLHDLEGK